MLETIAAATEFLKSKEFDLDDLIYAKDFAKISLLLTAANAVSDSRESKKQFITYGNELNRIRLFMDGTEQAIKESQSLGKIIMLN